MTLWMTKINGHSQAANYKVADDVSKSSEELGFLTINYRRFDDLKGNPDRRHDIIETLLAPIMENDRVFVQFPLWTHFLDFESEFYDALAAKKKVKIVALIHDVLPYMEGGVYDLKTNFWLNQLRKFDCLIVANDQMGDKLRSDQVLVPMVSMDMWDYRYQGPLTKKKFERKLIYTSGRELLTTDYHNMTPIYIYGRALKFDHPYIHYLGQKTPQDLPLELDGGFGLVHPNIFTESSKFDWENYWQYNNPTKLAMYLASGLPVIVSSKSPHAKMVKKNLLGLVLDDINEVDDALLHVTDDIYQQMLEQIKPFQEGIQKGIFVKRSLLAAMKTLDLSEIR